MRKRALARTSATRDPRIGVRLTAIGIVGPLVCAASIAVAKNEVEVVRVTEDVAMLVGRGGNIGVAIGRDGEGSVIVDDQFAPAVPSIVAALEGLGAGPIDFVVNTHWHSDHTGGNEGLATGGAAIVAHANVRERMSVEQFMEAFGRRVPASPQGALPIVTFERDVTLHRSIESLEIVHVPAAHTDGDSLVYFRQANVLHTGDTFVTNGLPFIDRSSGGSARGLLLAVERALRIANDQTKIIPGHGRLSDRKALVAYRDMVKTIVERVQKGIDEGQGLEAIQRSRPVRGYEDRATSFMKPDLFVKLVHESLSAEPKAF